jgi:hypothetical protein
MTYLDRILEVLTDELVTIDDIMRNINTHVDKTTYVIAAIKKGIANDLIRMVVNPNVKNKYKGHLYSLSV